MKKKGMSVKFITQAAVIAAIYVVLVVIFNYISFGPVQFRIAEAVSYTHLDVYKRQVVSPQPSQS